MRDEFERIVQDESRKLYGLSFRLTGNSQEAEDLCQEALARAYENFHKFEGRSHISTWLYRIAVNAWKNKMRSKRRVTILGFFRSEESLESGEEISMEDPKGPDASPEAHWEQRESGEILQSALMKLSAEDREIIVLRDLEDKSYEELAELLEIPMGTVKSRLARAREALRLKLGPLLKAKGESS